MIEFHLKREIGRLRARVAELEDRTWQGDPVLRSIMASSVDSIMLLDLAFRVRFTNHAPAGLTVEQTIGTPIFAHVPEEQHANVHYCFERVLHTGKPDSYEVTYTSTEGATTHVQARVAPVVAGEATTGFVVTSSDVTERRVAAIERDRFFTLSLDMLCIGTTDGYLTRLNPAFEQVLGRTEEELLSQPLLHFVHPDDHDPTIRGLERLAEGEGLTDFESRFRTKDGRHRLLSWHAVADDAGRMYAVVRDITEARSIEERLRQSEKMDAVGQLAGGIAHDFNNLALAILVNAELALEELVEDHPIVEHVVEIQRAGERAASLTRQLLAYSRRQPLRNEKVELGALVDRLQPLLQRLIPEHIRVAHETNSSPALTSGDPGQIEQVLMNFSINARDASREGGTIIIRTGRILADESFRTEHPFVRPGCYAFLQVQDDGSGMKPGVADRAFAPFFTTKEPGQGTGLGLSTVYGIVKQHGGYVMSDSDEGVGSTFTAYFPEADTPFSEDVSEPNPNRATTGGETILVAERERTVRDATVRVLEEAGYTVLAAEDGEMALRMLQDRPHRVRMALLDVVMPRMSGPETFLRLRESYPRMPAVFTRGYMDREGAMPPLPDGAVVLEKPYRAEELLRQVRRSLAATR